MWQTIIVIAVLALCVAFLTRHFINKYRRVSGSGSSRRKGGQPSGPSLPMAGSSPGPKKQPGGCCGD